MSTRVLIILVLIIFVSDSSSVEITCGNVAWKCDCESPPIMDCSRRDICCLAEEFVIPSGFTGIDLSGNIFDSQNDTTEPGTWFEKLWDVLTYVDLSSNRLESSDDSLLQDLRKLRTLKLSRNRLTNVTLHGLVSLEDLDVSFNRLRNLSRDTFAPCPRLRHIDLSYNPLLTIDKYLFANLSSLRYLDLSVTGLVHLHSGTFKSLTSLLTLRLTGNGFVKVPSAILQPLANLNYLDLSDNHFKVLAPNSFPGLEKLENLYLEQLVDLEKMDKHCLNGLDSLRVFSCSYNPNFHHVHPSAFQNEDAQFGTSYVGKLTEVRLHQNRLRTLNQSVLPWMRIDVIDVGENPWNCDCHLSWLGPLLSKKNAGFLGARCSSPEVNKGRSLTSLSVNEFTCELGVHESVLSVGLFVVLLAAVVLLVGLFVCWKLKLWARLRASVQMSYKRVETNTRLEMEEAKKTNEQL